MNKNYEQYFNLNFEEAYKLCHSKFTHSDLNNLLQNGKVFEKQYAAIVYDDVSNINDAEILINNLTGCDGKIREAVAFKIYSLVSKSEKVQKIFEKVNPLIFADATIDINANICRLVVETVKILKNDNDFAKVYTERIIEFTEQAFKELDKFIFKDKKYVINKQLFKLYWCLETLQNFYAFIPQEKLEAIILKASTVEEYTVREQAAKIIKMSGFFPNIKSVLLNDNNYYVKNAFN